MSPISWSKSCKLNETGGRHTRNENWIINILRLKLDFSHLLVAIEHITKNNRPSFFFSGKNYWFPLKADLNVNYYPSVFGRLKLVEFLSSHRITLYCFEQNQFNS